MKTLKVRIKKKLGDFHLDIDFETQTGIFALLGASGCGKSMTLKCIAGIETPDEGEISLGDQLLFDSERKINLPPQKRKVGYMFQDYALFPHMTVVQNIQAGMKKKSKEEAGQYIRQFHLQGLEQHYPWQLSGGQKQRAAMARMFASSPEVILLDEPFSALDNHLKWKMEEEMRHTLKEAGKPVVMVSHSRDEVYRNCDWIGCIDNGKLELAEPTKEFFQNPKTRAAALLTGCKNIALLSKIKENECFVEAWNLHLTEVQVPEEANYVGIRGHYFYPSDKPCSNSVKVKEYHILEDLFEWTVFIKTAKDESLQWKAAKDTKGKLEIPPYLYVKPQDVMFLR